MSSESPSHAPSIKIEDDTRSDFQKCLENIMRLSYETGVDIDFGGPYACK